MLFPYATSNRCATWIGNPGAVSAFTAASSALIPRTIFPSMVSLSNILFPIESYIIKISVQDKVLIVLQPSNASPHPAGEPSS